MTIRNSTQYIHAHAHTHIYIISYKYTVHIYIYYVGVFKAWNHNLHPTLLLQPALLVHPALVLHPPSLGPAGSSSGCAAIAPMHSVWRQGPATWPFSSCNCIKSDLPPLTGHNQKGQKDRTVICQYFRNGFYFFFSLPGLALTTNSGHLWLFFCKHHFDSLRGLTMARCSPWNQIMITQPNNEHMLDGWYCHVWRLKSLYGYGLSH